MKCIKLNFNATHLYNVVYLYFEIKKKENIFLSVLKSIIIDDRYKPFSLKLKIYTHTHISSLFLLIYFYSLSLFLCLLLCNLLLRLVFFVFFFEDHFRSSTASSFLIILSNLFFTLSLFENADASS